MPGADPVGEPRIVEGGLLRDHAGPALSLAVSAYDLHGSPHIAGRCEWKTLRSPFDGLRLNGGSLEGIDVIPLMLSLSKHEPVEA